MVSIYKFKKGIVSVCFVFLLITSGFIGILVFEGVMDEGGVEAATTRYVGLGQTYSTITSAIAASTPGDTIRVYAGTYKENFYINNSLTIKGNGSKTIIQGKGQARRAEGRQRSVKTATNAGERSRECSLRRSPTTSSPTPSSPPVWAWASWPRIPCARLAPGEGSGSSRWSPERSRRRCSGSGLGRCCWTKAAGP